MANRVGRLPGPLVLFLVAVTGLALGSWLDAAIGFLRFGKPGLRYLWMFYPGFDFVDYTLQFPYLHTPRFFTLSAFPWVYPAPAIFVLYPFYKIVSVTNRATGFAVFAMVVTLANVVVALKFRGALVLRGLSRRAASALVLITAFCGWPLYFALQRGNIECLLWIGIAAGVVFYARGRYAVAAVLFGAVGSVKLYPLLFLTLLLRPRRYRELGLGMLVAIGTTLLGLRFLEPDVAYASRQIASGVQRWTAITASGYPSAGIGVDHSTFGLLRQITMGGILKYPHALNWYLGIAAVLYSVLFLSRVLFLPRPNQVLFLACATVLLPPTSFDYTLVSILIPFGWMAIVCVEQVNAGQDVRRFFLPFALLGVALAPLTFVHSHAGPEFYVEGAVRSVALLVLIFVSAAFPFLECGAGERRFEGNGAFRP